MIFTVNEFLKSLLDYYNCDQTAVFISGHVLSQPSYCMTAQLVESS